MKKLMFIFLLIPSLLQAQGNVKEEINVGIGFVEGLSWKEVVKKAKKEGKYIFVDCFATWCAPCKAMEKNVFVKREVGDFFNKHYISVRLQMDRTNKDNDAVKKWYKFAAGLINTYGVPGYPTFLFFSPDGRLVNRATGYNTVKSLIENGRKAMEPGMTAPYNVYYKWLGEYQQGKRDYSKMAGLADTALRLGQEEVARAVSKEYRTYLLSNKRDKWYQPANINFMARFIEGSKDPFFTIFLKEGKLVDTIMEIRGFADHVIDKIVQQEEIEPITKPQKGWRLSTDKPVMKDDPDWLSLRLQIVDKYGVTYADRNVLQAQIMWYNDQHKWSEVARYFTLFVKNYPISYIDGKPAIFFDVNYVTWDAIFLRSVDKEHIDAAIKCMADAVTNYKPLLADYIDTYANLLYKAGRREEAIRFQERAVAISPDHIGKKETLSRMKAGKPTWPHYISSSIWAKGIVD